MKVGELIAKLQEYDEDEEVAITLGFGITELLFEPVDVGIGEDDPEKGPSCLIIINWPTSEE